MNEQKPGARTNCNAQLLATGSWLLSSFPNSAFIIQHFPSSHFPLIFACYSDSGDDGGSGEKMQRTSCGRAFNGPPAAFANRPVRGGSVNEKKIWTETNMPRGDTRGQARTLTSYIFQGHRTPHGEVKSSELTPDGGRTPRARPYAVDLHHFRPKPVMDQMVAAIARRTHRRHRATTGPMRALAPTIHWGVHKACRPVLEERSHIPGNDPVWREGRSRTFCKVDCPGGLQIPARATIPRPTTPPPVPVRRRRCGKAAARAKCNARWVNEKKNPDRKRLAADERR